jgi:hypothetical protein
MKKFLLALADKPTPQFPDRLLRYLDRYVRKGSHHDAPSRPTGWALAAWLRQRNDAWFQVYSYEGIRAAINLRYDLA